MTDMFTPSTHPRDNTLCSRGHTHQPWPTAGVLHIAKCESHCGFCQKETKTAADLRKHVAIHIKNEGLTLTIAEGSNGRGKLEMPISELHQRQSPIAFSASDSPRYLPPSVPTLTLQTTSQSQNDNISDQILPRMSKAISGLSQPQSHSSNAINFASISHQQSRTLHGRGTPSMLRSSSQLIQSYESTPPPQLLSQILDLLSQQPDPFHSLSAHNLATRLAWTVISASEGARILEMCRRSSFVDGHEGQQPQPHTYYETSSLSAPLCQGASFHSSLSASSQLNLNALQREHWRESREDQGLHQVPCYSGLVLFDEEWQTHMREVHGVFLLWPNAWMKRVEVLDLDPFGGDTSVYSSMIIDS